METGTRLSETLFRRNRNLSEAQDSKTARTESERINSKDAEEKGMHWEQEPPEPSKCEFCNATLYHEGIVAGAKVYFWNPVPPRCKCDKALKYWSKQDAEHKRDMERRKLVEEQKRLKARSEALLGKSGLKKRFLTRTFDNFQVTDQNKKAYQVAKDYADKFDFYSAQGRGLYFEGTYGTGKTHLATAISLQLIEQGRKVICKTSIDLLDDIKRTFDSGSSSRECEVMDSYKRADLLVIDDLGKEVCTNWSLAILYAILNDRYEDLKPTIITTNYNADQLVWKLTPPPSRTRDNRSMMDNTNVEAMMSRLKGTSAVVTMAWDDWRAKID